MNLTNGDEYVGKDKTGDPENHRWKHHRKMAAVTHPKSYFHRAIKTYGGPLRFKWSIVWCGPIEELCAKEVYYIAKRHTFVGDPKYVGGYNLTHGGDGTNGHHHSKKTKKQMSAAQKLRFEDP